MYKTINWLGKHVKVIVSTHAADPVLMRDGISHWVDIRFTDGRNITISPQLYEQILVK